MLGNIQQKEVLTAEEVAQYLDLNIRTVQAMIKDGELPAMKMGKSYRFSRRLLLEFIESKIKQDFYGLTDIQTTTEESDDLSNKQ